MRAYARSHRPLRVHPSESLDCWTHAPRAYRRMLSCSRYVGYASFGEVSEQGSVEASLAIDSRTGDRDNDSCMWR
jgi:hypothetical protein